MLFFLAIMAVLGLAFSAMSPEARRRLLQLAVDLANQLIDEAVRERPECDAFRRALRARTRWAVVTPALIVLNVTIYLLMVREVGPVNDPETIARWGGNYWLLTRNGDWWRLVTSIFVHAGFFQLLINALGVAQIGLIAERLVGRVIAISVFLTAGVFASLMNLMAHPTATSFGASGAICGLYGLLIASWIWGMRRRSDLSIPLATIKMIAPAASVFVLYNLANDSVATAAELTGVLIGLMWGAVLAKGVNDLKPGIRRVPHLGAAAAVLALVAAVPLRGATDIKPELERAAAVEERTVDAFQKAAERFKSGRITADALAVVIDRTIIPELRVTDARLRALVAVPDVHKPMVAVAQDYVQLRIESWRLRSDYIRKAQRVPAPGAEMAEYRVNNRTIARAEVTERAALEALRKFHN
jgi:membrane associated rhomboid family serine protease